MNTSTQSIERYINNGGAVGDAQRAISVGNKVAVAGVQAGAGIAGVTAGVAGTGTVASAVTTALTSVAGAVGVSVPVVGWVTAGVLLAVSGGILGASRRRAKFLAKDRGLLQKYIRKFSKKSSDWRDKEAKKQISQLQYILTLPKTTFNAKRQAKAELKLEALYFLIRQEQVPLIQQRKQQELMIAQSAQTKTQLIIFVPVILGTSFLLAYLARSKK